MLGSHLIESLYRPEAPVEVPHGTCLRGSELSGVSLGRGGEIGALRCSRQKKMVRNLEKGENVAAMGGL